MSWTLKTGNFKISHERSFWKITKGDLGKCLVSFDPSENPPSINGSWYCSNDCNPTNEDELRGASPLTGVKIECLATPQEYNFSTGVQDIWSVGFNFYGELARLEGKGGVEGVETLGIVTGLNQESVAQLTLGCNHGAARTSSGRLWTWGSNAQGQLGYSSAAGFAVANAVPQLVDQVGKVSNVSAGGSFTLFMTEDRSGRSLFGMGSNRYGQLASEEGFATDSVLEAPRKLPIDANHVTVIATGRHHVLLLNDSGLFSWGHNEFGQLGRPQGIGTTEAGDYRVLAVSPSSFEGKKIATIAAGRYHSLALTVDGDLYCFGSNFRGQCGPAGPDGSSQPTLTNANPTPKRIPRTLLGDEPASWAVAGQYATFVLMRSGKLWGFGRNFHGMLTEAAGQVGTGVPVSVPFLLSEQVRASMGADGMVVKLVSGKDHAILMVAKDNQTDPELLVVGSNGYGQLDGVVGKGEDSVAFRKLGGILTPCAGQGPLSRDGVCKSGTMKIVDVDVGCDQTMIVTERPECPPGSFSPTNKQPCFLCPPGKYQDGLISSSSSCALCPQGKFSYEGSTTCIVCPLGTNTSGEGSPESGCLQLCPTGTYGVQQEIGLMGLAPCRACNVSRYNDEEGATACKHCPALTANLQEGALSVSSCRQFCDAGTVSSDGLRPAGGACQSCPAGSYQPELRQTACLACPKGFKAEGHGATFCSSCPPGSFQNQVGTTACESCALGLYQDMVNSTVCQRCPLGSSTTVVGASSRGQCVLSASQWWSFGWNDYNNTDPGIYTLEVKQVVFPPALVANDVSNLGSKFGNRRIRQVAAGSSHTLFLTDDDRLYGIGDNFYGQLASDSGMQPSCYEPGPLLPACDPMLAKKTEIVELERAKFGPERISKIFAGRLGVKSERARVD
eukprot:746676-Hanusia_phi.AAC.6